MILAELLPRSGGRARTRDDTNASSSHGPAALPLQAEAVDTKPSLTIIKLFHIDDIAIRTTDLTVLRLVDVEQEMSARRMGRQARSLLSALLIVLAWSAGHVSGFYLNRPVVSGGLTRWRMVRLRQDRSKSHPSMTVSFRCITVRSSRLIRGYR